MAIQGLKDRCEECSSNADRAHTRPVIDSLYSWHLCLTSCVRSDRSNDKAAGFLRPVYPVTRLIEEEQYTMYPQNSFVIQGQNPLSGEVIVDGNKNAALPLIAASVVREGKVTFRRIQPIDDVSTLCSILGNLS